MQKKKKRKFLDYGNGNRIEITNNKGLAEWFPEPLKIDGKWVFPILVVEGESNA